MILRTVLVDDEPLARERLRLLLSELPEVHVVAECRNGAEAIAFLESNEIDLLLLDIQMPGMSGLEVMEEVGYLQLPATVFVTAYEEHAVEAFNLQAVDYLTKPVKPERLRRALERVRYRLAAHQAFLTQPQFSGVVDTLRTKGRQRTDYAKRLLIRDGAKDTLVGVESISWIEACDYYSGLHIGTQTKLIRQSITKLCGNLDPSIFLRIHRSFIVNLNFVAEIRRDGPKRGTVLMKDGTELSMSRLGRSNIHHSRSDALRPQVIG